MSQTELEGETTEMDRLLVGAARTMANVRYCWLMTASQTANFSARPMGRLSPEPGDGEWTVRFVTDGRSRKARDIRRAGRVELVFQDDAADAYVAAAGAANLCEDAPEIVRRWKRAYDRYFPTEEDRANATFVEVDIDRMELWIRGVTPEPFGMRATTVARSAGGAWRLSPAGRAP
jgi:general stress protein 26